MEPIRVAIIDDHPIFRNGIASMLHDQGEFELVGEGDSAEDAVRMARTAPPDVMLMDVSMPGGGLAALASITRRAAGPKIIMLTVSESDADVVSAFSAGANGYLLKGIHKSELIDALKRVHAGATVIDPSLAVRVIVLLSQKEPQKKVSSSENLEGLTPRELDVLKCVEKGLSNKQIGLWLGLNPRTVKNYMTRIMTKLHVRNRVEAAISIRRVPVDE